jgi:hypothetical protein
LTYVGLGVTIPLSIGEHRENKPSHEKEHLVPHYYEALLAVGCGSGGSQKNPIVVGQHLVDPSSNWKMSVTNTNNNVFILSCLFSQTGAVVTGISFSEIGNQTAGFAPSASQG